MIFLYFIIFLISVFYFIVILFFSIGWNRIKLYRKGNFSPSDVYISIVVAFRNEEKNILSLINSILNQSLSKNLFELILIDDNSTDNSWQLVLQNTSKHSNIRCLQSIGNQGKKNAIKLGIDKSIGRLIITTDADCTHHPEWLETIYSFYQSKKPKIIIGPVVMTGKSILRHFQKIDFLSLIASGAGASGINRPIMCNWANLAFEKEVFEELADPMKMNLKSGDDIFLLHQVKRKYTGQIKFLKAENAIVKTKAEESICAFLRQRIRWSSKSKMYFDKDTILTALAVFFMNFSMLVNLIFSSSNKSFLYLFIFQFIAKAFVDFMLLYEATLFIKESKLLRYFIPVELLNTIVIPMVAIAGFVYEVKWKGTKS